MLVLINISFSLSSGPNLLLLSLIDKLHSQPNFTLKPNNFLSCLFIIVFQGAFYFLLENEKITWKIYISSESCTEL